MMMAMTVIISIRVNPRSSFFSGGLQVQPAPVRGERERDDGTRV
jgi:hypothetical protein